MNAYKNASYAGYALYFFGIVLILFGFGNLMIEQELDRNGVETTGTVFELEVNEPYRQAWVEFTADGQTVQFLDKLFWNQDFEKYQVGDQVSVIYEPADPQGTATINDFFQRNTAPWWPSILGLVVFFTGFFMRRSMLKKAEILEGQQKGAIAVDPNAHKQSLNRIMLITFGVICLIIAIFVVALGTG